MNEYAQAVNELNAGNRSQAERSFLRLLNKDFDNPILLFALGMVYVGQRKNGAAHSLLRRALERMDGANEAYRRLGIFPDGVSDAQKRVFVKQQTAEALNGLALTYRYEDRNEEAQKTFEKALALSPNDPDIHCNIGTLYVNDGRPQGGLHWLNKALALQPGHTDARWNLALLQLEMGDFQNGWVNYDEGSRAKTQLNRTYRYPDGKELAHWNGEEGKSVLAYGEQGVGDEIMFASCLPDLMALSKEVVFDCHPRLVKLFERSFGIECHGTRKKEWIEWMAGRTFDYRAALGSLPRHFRRERDWFPGLPYLKAGVNEEAKKLPGLKVGLSWIGGALETRQAIRSMPLATLRPLLEQNASFISLQYTDCGPEIDRMQDELGKPIKQFDFITDSQSDYDLTAEVVNACDVVISVNTSVIHLAGALGKPCWVLTPNRSAWRYGIEGDGMPWYQSVRQFRQTKGEDWKVPVTRVAQELSALTMNELVFDRA